MTIAGRSLASSATEEIGVNKGTENCDRCLNCNTPLGKVLEAGMATRKATGILQTFFRTGIAIHIVQVYLDSVLFLLKTVKHFNEHVGVRQQRYLMTCLNAEV